MKHYRDAVRPLSAWLNSDGSIELELYIPEQDAPMMVTVPAERYSKKLAGDSARAIDLDESEDAASDEPLRFMIEGRIAQIERALASNRAANVVQAVARV